MLSTVGGDVRLNFNDTGSTEEMYWVRGADEPYPAPVNQRAAEETEDSAEKKRYWDACIEELGQPGAVGLLANGDTRYVEAYLCPIYELAAIYEHPTTKKKTSILHELVELGDPSIFDEELPGMLVQFKWDAYARSVTFWQFVEYFVMIIFFTVHTLSATKKNEQMHPGVMFDVLLDCLEDDRRGCAWTVWVVVSWVSWAICVLIYMKVMVVGELQSVFKQGLAAYLRDPQNSFDLLNGLLLSTCLALAPIGIAMHIEFKYLDMLRALAILFGWFCMLFRFICFDRLQKLVLVLFQIVLDMNFVSFMVTTMIIIVGFAFAFLCLMRNTDPMMSDLR
eukprot:SAG22_NODE_256_length_13561_cov_3.225524_2_plen_336_part_00